MHLITPSQPSPGRGRGFILVTRPAPYGKQLCEFLKSEGYQTCWLPTLAISPVAAPDPLPGNSDWLIFISPLAVRHGIPLLNAQKTHYQIAAIGTGTAHRLTEAGYPVNACPDTPGSAEALLDLPVFKAVAGQHIVILKGQGGRHHLRQTLRARGAVVTEHILYHRTCPVSLAPAHCQTLIRRKAIEATLITSGQGLLNLLKLLPEDCRTLLKAVPLLVISPRLARLAKRLGFDRISLAEGPGEGAIMIALKTL